MKNLFRIKKLPIKKLADPLSNREAVSKKFVPSKLNDPSILKDSAYVDFNDKSLDNVPIVFCKSEKTTSCISTFNSKAKCRRLCYRCETTLVRKEKSKNFFK